MTMYTKFDVECPYCGNQFNQVFSKDELGTYQAIYCDIEDTPGCGKLFVVRPVLRPEIVSIHKVERGE
jgi:predicted DCC family thiol-disulfide oxidoreductase YuxK